MFNSYIFHSPFFVNIYNLTSSADQEHYANMINYGPASKIDATQLLLSEYRANPYSIATIDNSSFQHTHYAANPAYMQAYPSGSAQLRNNMYTQYGNTNIELFKSYYKLYFKGLVNFTSIFAFYGIQPGQCCWNENSPSLLGSLSTYYVVKALSTTYYINYENLDSDSYSNYVLYKILRQTGNKLEIPAILGITYLGNSDGGSVNQTALNYLNKKTLYLKVN